MIACALSFASFAFAIFAFPIIDNEPTKIDFDSAKMYLRHYGYLNNSAGSDNPISYKSDENFLNAVITFQENYGLEADGNINLPTLEAMRSRRCGVSDYSNAYRLKTVNGNESRYLKWGINTLKWTFITGTDLQTMVTERAFELWSENANINFIKSKYKPNIIISMGSMNHSMRSVPKRQCNFPFDGEGEVLAHAFQPMKEKHLNPLEIHIDADEIWDYSLSGLARNYSLPSLLEVLTHEIGHVLGIEHTFLYKDAIMYPYYSVHKNSNLTTFKLHKDDINAVHRLYGYKVKSAPNVTVEKTFDVPLLSPTTMKTTAATAATTTTMYPTSIKSSINSVQAIIPDTNMSIPILCELNNLNLFLVVKDRLYIFYEKWFWVKKLNEKHHGPPALIKDWLPNLPEMFQQIDVIYMSPNGVINIFINGVIYRYSQELKLLNSTSDSRSSNYLKLLGAVNTNSGRTVLFYTNNFYREIDDRDFEEIRFGYISADFPSVPTKFKSVFRYTNGRLYFFVDNTYFEYNEFENDVVKAAPFDISLFDVECYDRNMLEKIRDAIGKMLSFNY